MATSNTYYINGPSLGSSTAVFLNANLTTVAPNGFYSDGVISREQVSGVLLPQQNCPSCATPCGTAITGSGRQGIYLINLNAGEEVSDVGAIIIRFNPLSVPDGIRATFNGLVYNKLTSPVDGYHKTTTPGGFTYIGLLSTDCGISGTTYPNLPKFLYNGTTFAPTGETQTITVNPGDVSLGVSAPGNCMLVIPKLTASPSIVNFEFVGPCAGTLWSIAINCPVLLTGFSSSVNGATSSAACVLSETTTYYNASLANTPGTVGLYDFVYSDAYGSTQLAAGFYRASGSIVGGNDWFQVDANGIVIALGVCGTPPAETYNCVLGNCVDPGDGTGEYSNLEACEASCGGPTYDLYIADVYDCAGCTYTSTGVTVALPSGTTPVYGNYYQNISFDGNYYVLLYPTSVGPGIILLELSSTGCSGC